MDKFKVGDRIRLKQNPEGVTFTSDIGVGTVQEVTVRGYKVVFDSHIFVRRLTDDDLELVESQTEPLDHA